MSYLDELADAVGYEEVCTCPPEHTVAKLGHCRSCEAYPQTWQKRPEDVAAGFLLADEEPFAITSTAFSCGSKVCSMDWNHGPHDFNWATYADDQESYGVCRCGLSSLHFDLLHLP